MSKAPSPLLGFNNNVRHKNKVFHIQTEDSGIKHPHIITHLFMDGGRILKSVKQSYAEHVGSEGLADRVRFMMKEQHKAMMIALRDGQFDHALEDPNGGAQLRSVPAPAASHSGGANVKSGADESNGARPGANVRVRVPALERTLPSQRPEAPSAEPTRRTGAPSAAPAQSGQGRYAPTVSASIFRPRRAAATPGSERRDHLDEVVLAYLAEDIERDRKK